MRRGTFPGVLVGGLLLAVLPPGHAAELPEIARRPFPMDWAGAERSVVDLSGFLDAPAGKGGHLKVRGKHLVKPDGTRFRIWGVNLTTPACFPDKKEAEQLAGDLARLGINCVRFHHLDAPWGRNLFEPRRTDTRHLDADNLDRLDYLVAQLKRRGIYSNLNLNVSRHYRADDGVRDYKLLGFGKTATYFDPRLIELQKEFARQLLTHRNPYTGNEYRHEPAVALVEMVNENSLLEGWVNWRLIGNDAKAGDTWSPLPVSYDRALTEQYNRHLEKTLSPERLRALRTEAGVGPDGAVPRLRPDQFGKASKERFRTEAAFYAGLERRFFEGMRHLLRDELGVRSLLIGTADHNDWFAGYEHIRSNLALDFVDGHGYWEHPNIGKTTSIKNTPMVNDPLDSTVVQFARSPVAGLPYTLSETNHPFPHRYACEGFPILTAYALLHDWDGIYWFDWGPGRAADVRQGIPPYGWFGVSTDPIKVTNLVACAAMWHRHDVRPAERTVLRGYTAEQTIEALRMNSSRARPFFDAAFPLSLPLVHATRWSPDGKGDAAYPAAAPLGRIESDTGQLGWYHADRKKGLVTIDTPRTQGLIGFVKAGDKKVSQLSAAVDNEFCALVCTSLDGKPLAEATELLLAATAGGIANTDMRWEADGKTLAAWGRGPVRIEPVTGTIRLARLQGATRVRVQPLTAAGLPLGAEQVARRQGEAWEIRAGEPATTWYRVRVDR